MNTKNIIAALIALLFLPGCAPYAGYAPLDDSMATQEGISSAADGSNQFAVDFYLEIKDSGENIFFSPFSISTAFAMAYEGAKGNTSRQMEDVFYFEDDYIERTASYAAIHNIINAKSKKYELHTANALWAEQNYTFLENYTSTIRNYYGGNTTNMDFINNAEQSRQEINRWVEEKTKEKIKDLLPAGSINYLTRLVLTNAIYFKGEWVKKFDKDDTKDMPFKVDSETEVTVPMMKLSGENARFNYAETENMQILEMMYDGGNLSMLVLLPRENLDEIEPELSAENLAKWKSMMRERKIDVYFPKFRLETEYSLPGTLQDMGMTDAFSWPEADFSGMDGGRNLFISGAFHKAFIEVNEEGTEAAAATAIVMTMGMAFPNEFRADHPFIFIIQEKTTGSILFMGRMSNPAE